MKLYSEQERIRRLKIIENMVKQESWAIIKESLEFWVYAKSKEVIELYGMRKDEEAKHLATQIWAVQRVFAEPSIIIDETNAWLKKKEWMRKIADRILPKKDPSPSDGI